MDRRTVLAGDTLPRGFTLVAKASGNPIVAGTVNHYLKALTGANAGQWWRDSDQTWQVAETANAMTHQADGHWTRALAASPWTAGVLYLEYAKESGDLHVPTGWMLVASYTPSADSSRRVDLGAWLGVAPAVLANQLLQVDVLRVAATVQTAGDLAAILALIKTKADLLPASPAATGDAMTLTSGERTAIRDGVWGNSEGERSLTQTAAEVAAALDGTRLVIHRGSSWTWTLTGLPTIPADYDALWFTVKSDPDSETDDQAKIRIRAGVGLERLMGAAAATAGQGSVVRVSGASVTLGLDAAATALLSKTVAGRDWHYDVQYVRGTQVETVTQERLAVNVDVTRAVTAD